MSTQDDPGGTIEPSIQGLADQGYIPKTCTLPHQVAVMLVLAEVGEGRSPCWGCAHDRTICKGQPERPS